MNSMSVNLRTLTGEELDRRMRKILMAATRETVLSATAALVELGFSPRLSFQLIDEVITAKEKR